MSPGDLREQARGFQPGELLVELAGVVDLKVDSRHDIRGTDRLHDVGEDETAGRVERAGDALEEPGLACAFEVMDCKSRYDEVERGDIRNQTSAPERDAPRYVRSRRRCTSASSAIPAHSPTPDCYRCSRRLDMHDTPRRLDARFASRAA